MKHPSEPDQTGKSLPQQSKKREKRERAPRAKVSIRARWEGKLGRQAAEVISLSKTGCFVLSGGEAKPQELIRLELLLAEGKWISLGAEVVEVAEEIGFAMRFTSVENADQARLDQFLEKSLGAES